MRLSRWLICLLVTCIWLSGAAHAAVTERVPSDIQVVPAPGVTQAQKEAWLLDAITRGDRALAWQIAGHSFHVQSGSAVYIIDGLSIDLAYRGHDGRPLMHAIKQRAGHYRANPVALHRDLSDPTRITQQLVTPPTSDIHIPGSVHQYELLAAQGVEYHQINGKLYHLEMGLYRGTPQDLLVYNAPATHAYRANPFGFRIIGSFHVN